MFCPSCGTEYSVGLPYCNRCGANLGSAVAEPSETRSIDLTKAIAGIGTTMTATTIGGFIALIVGAVKLAEKPGIGTDPLVIMMAMGMVTILTVDIFLSRQLSHLIRAGLSGTTRSEKHLKPATTAPNQLGRPVTAPLAPSTSVTENTTRFLEPR
jgi:hypothetical protein